MRPKWVGRFTRFLIAAALPATLAACMAPVVEEDPLQARVEEVDRRLARMERIAGTQTLTELTQRIDTLQAEVRRLRGQVEVLENSARIASIESARRASAPSAAASGAESSAATAAASAAVPDPDATRTYTQAFESLKAGNFAAAISGLREFLAKHAAHELAPNAQYWLGEAHYVTRDYPAAQASFEALLQQWPQSAKAADAMLKLGYTQLESKRPAEARQTLEGVGTRYPGTEAARLAAERLRQMTPNVR